MKHTQPLIELRNVTKRFNYVEALKHVDFTAMPGEIVALVGDNGAGKSTLVNIIAGMLQPDDGTIRIQGEEVALTGVSDAVQHGVAAVFQNQQFCDNLDVAANLFLGQELHHHEVRDDHGMLVRSRRVLSTLTANISTAQSMTSLSGGQRQIVAIARTLLNDPRVIVLDEPTASLSVIQTAEVLGYIRKLQEKGRVIIMVCHDLPDVFAVSTRIVVMRRGHIFSEHYTADTSYEQIIAEISGVRSTEEGTQASRKISRHIRNSNPVISRHPRREEPQSNTGAAENVSSRE